MSHGGSTLFRSSADQRQQDTMTSPVRVGQSSCDEEAQTDDGGEWYSGDGVCPTTSQFNMCYQANFDIWREAASICPEGSRSIRFYIDAFLYLLKDVPPFFHNPPKGINITGGARSPLLLQSSLQLETTDDASCNQRHKSIDYLQCLGFPVPIIYKTKAETQLPVTIPISADPPRSGYFTNIVLAWSYIISCRWAEILHQAGERSLLLHDRGVTTTDCFWDIVIKSRWIAQVKSQKSSFYSPWMLWRGGGSTEDHNDWIPVSLNSSHAFNILLDFCIAEGLEGELLLGLTSVLMLTSRNIPPPKLAPPIIIPQPAIRSPHKDTVFHKLFDSIDKCMFLSSTQDALDSLLCSAFFDPCIPCNLMGAASLGVRGAFIADEVDSQQLLNAITCRKPHLSLLWAAAICCDQVLLFLNMALKRLPPLCLVASLWTNTVQSFLQVPYRLDEKAESVILRADEFQISYFCRSHISVPWSPSPPFGTTTLENLSLEVRAHLKHGHKPLSWMIYWIMDSGAKIPASTQHRLGLSQTHSIQYYYTVIEASQSLRFPERHGADEQSWSATSRLFNWHRYYDDGIWLDDGTRNIEAVRQLQMHPWIVDQFDDDQHDPFEEDKHGDFHRESILEWNAKVEKYRQSGEIMTP